MNLVKVNIGEKMVAPLVGITAAAAAKLIAKKLASNSAKKTVKKLVEPKSAVKVVKPSSALKNKIKNNAENKRVLDTTGTLPGKSAKQTQAEFIERNNAYNNFLSHYFI